MEENNFVVIQGIYSKGFGMIGKLVMQDTNLTVTAKCIYCYICSFAGNGFSAFPSSAKMCKDLGIARNTFFKHLKLLKDYDYLRMQQQKIDGKYSSNIYTIIMDPNPTEYQKRVFEKPSTKKQYTKKKDTKKRDTNKNKSFNKNSSYNKNTQSHNNFQKHNWDNIDFDRYYTDPTKDD